jgi:hypothetical protein
MVQCGGVVEQVVANREQGAVFQGAECRGCGKICLETKIVSSQRSRIVLKIYKML